MHGLDLPGEARALARRVKEGKCLICGRIHKAGADHYPTLPGKMPMLRGHRARI